MGEASRVETSGMISSRGMKRVLVRWRMEDCERVNRSYIAKWSITAASNVVEKLDQFRLLSHYNFVKVLRIALPIYDKISV